MTEQIFLYVITAILLAGGTIFTTYLIRRGVKSTDDELERLRQAGEALAERLRTLEKVVSELEKSVDLASEGMEKLVRLTIKGHAENTRAKFADLDSDLLQSETRLKAEIAELRQDISSNRGRLDGLLEAMQRRVSKCATENLTRTEFFRLWDLLQLSVKEINSRIDLVSEDFQRAELRSKETRERLERMLIEAARKLDNRTRK